MDYFKENYKKIIAVVVCLVILYVVLQNPEMITSPLRYMLRLLTPFIVGGMLAFILNIPVSFLERNVVSKLRMFHHKKRKTICRILSIVLALMLVVCVIAIVLIMVVPELYNSFATLGRQLTMEANVIPSYIDRLTDVVPALGGVLEQLKSEWLNIDWKELGTAVVEFLTTGGFFSSTFTVASSIISGITNFFIGLVFAVYVLFQKESLARQCKRLLYAVFQEKGVDAFLRVCKMTGETFHSFLSGQCLEAVILACMFFIALSVFRFPYALVISVLICVTALIPIFGTFISCAIGALLILMDSPIRALWFIVLFLILQQIEGNFIYPKVVGNSVGLPPIWVFAAVTLGASVGGILGMIFAIPITSVLYTLLGEFIARRVKEKQISKDKIG